MADYIKLDSDTEPIREMIATALVGDGDAVLNILEKICDRLDSLERSIDILSECSERTERVRR